MPAHRPLLVAQGDVVAYGAIQSVLWASQTVLSPVIGMASDYFGRRPVIIATLLCSALSNALLALADDLKTMGLARLIGGLGFQMFLFRAYFAATAPKKQRAAKFGIIGVLQAALLFRPAPLRSAPPPPPPPPSPSPSPLPTHTHTPPPTPTPRRSPSLSLSLSLSLLPPPLGSPI